MRLLAYTDAAGVGGAEISLANLLTVLADDPGVEVSVLGVSEEVVDRVAPPGVTAVVAPVRRHPRLMGRLRPDVVHANLAVPWSGAVGIAAALALRRTRVLAVQQLPLRTVELDVWLRTRTLLRRLDAHVAVGAASSRRIEDFYALGRGSVRSIPNFVPDLPLPERTTSRSSGTGFTIGSLGRLDRMKGYDLLIPALADLPEVRLVIVGEGTQRAELQRLARDHGVADRLELPGWDPQPRKRFGEWDVFCLPSRSEGFPLSIVEAMLAGLPVVATRVGSVPEAVEHERTGLLVDKDDQQALVGALRRLRDPGRREELGRSGRKRAAANFTVDRMATAYRSLYDQLLSAPRRSRWRPGPERA
jgi:glycosyltransferase involved in cell wall biosynthesis